MRNTGGTKKPGRKGQGIAPVQVRVWFPPDVLTELEATAETGYCSRSALIVELVRAGLKARPRSTDATADVAAIVGPRQQGVVTFRKHVLDGWRAVRAVARRSGEPIKVATIDYIRRINNETGAGVSLRTLYRWDRLHLEHGIMGLVDDRAPAQAKKQSYLSSSERPSKAVRKASKPGCTHARQGGSRQTT